MSFSPTNLRAIREARGLTRQQMILEFARLGRRPPVERTIATWEKGDTAPKADDLAALAMVLGCEVQDFFIKEGAAA